MADLNPYAEPPALDQAQDPNAPPHLATTDQTKLDGPAGRAVLQPVPKGLDQAEWARLNDQLRHGIRGSGVEHFSEEQQSAIRAYFEKLSASSVTPNK